MVYSLVNGQSGDSVAVFDRGLAYGDGLFETIRLINGQPLLFPLHLARLQAGCQRLGLHFDTEALLNEIRQLSQFGTGQDQVLKIIITRGIGGRGYRPAANLVANRILTLQPYAEDVDAVTHGIQLYCCQTPLARQPLLAGLKHLNRLEQVLAAAELPQSCPEGLMRDTLGQVIEGTRSNLFLVLDDQLVTPDLSHSGINGVLRQWLCDTQSVDIRTVDLAMLLAATEVFVCNSVFGIYPVTALLDEKGSVAAFAPGDRTRTCQSGFAELLDAARHGDLPGMSAELRVP
jgi:4-amino-4-deoxychorismate lyase